MKKKLKIVMAVILLIAVVVVVTLICINNDEDSQKKGEKRTDKNEIIDETGEENSRYEDETVGEMNTETEGEDYSDIVSDVEAVFDAALDYIVEDKDLTATEEVRNAILENTEITVNYANENICNVSVKYPNVAKLLKEEASLQKQATEEEIDEMMEGLVKAIENEDVEMVENTIDVQVIEKDGIWNIKWTSELYDAVTGGLYSIE